MKFDRDSEFPIRVLMTADTVGGVWTYAAELIRALEPHGTEVLLATMGRPMSREQRGAIAGLSNLEIVESNYKLEWMDLPWADVRAAGEWLLGLEEYFAPDVIHLNGYAHAALGWRAPKIVTGHSCVLSWWGAVKREPAPADWNHYRTEVQNGLRAADLVIAPTGAMLNCLLENYGLLPETRVIPNGRRLASFSPAKKENFVLSAGRLWDEAKNVKAVCACSLTLPWPVLIAGETESPDGSGMAGALGSAQCLGRLDEHQMADWFSRAGIYAMPARYEPFGLSILEAALCGCPLVLGDIPSLRENWRGAALFVDPSDHDQLGRALQKLIAEPAARQELGQLARERAEQFDIEVTAIRYLETYRSVIERRAPTDAEECVTA